MRIKSAESQSGKFYRTNDFGSSTNGMEERKQKGTVLLNKCNAMTSFGS